jgi:protease IV
MPVTQEIFRALVWIVALFILFAAGLLAFGAWHDEWSGFNASTSVGDGTCNIAVIPVYGEMTSYAQTDAYGLPVGGTSIDQTEYWIRTAEGDPSIKGMLFMVDSGGGAPSAGETLANDLKRSPLPSAALVRDVAASAAYWLASGTDQIFASALSNVGSIGVTMSYLERSSQNEDSGLYYVDLASGPYKDTGNPDKFLTEEEHELLQRDIDLMHQEFVRQIADNRGLPITEVEALADGSTMLGAAALDAGLIDQIGDRESVRNWFAMTLELDPEQVIFCDE